MDTPDQKMREVVRTENIARFEILLERAADEGPRVPDLHVAHAKPEHG